MDHARTNFHLGNPLLQRPQVFTQLAPWKDFVRDSFPWLELQDYQGRDFRASADGQVLQQSMVMGISAEASQVVRTRRLAGWTEAGYIKLFWQFSGRSEISQDGRRVVLRPGAVSVCDIARPYTFRVGDGANFGVVLMPYAACPGWESISQSVSATALTDAGSANAALGALAGLAGTPGAVDDAASGDVFRAVEWLLSGCLHRAAIQLGRQRPEEAGLDPLAALTLRERHILAALRSGASNEAIAHEKRVSANTVKFHLKNIYRKLGVSGRIQAIEAARRLL